MVAKARVKEAILPKINIRLLVMLGRASSHNCFVICASFKQVFSQL